MASSLVFRIAGVVILACVSGMPTAIAGSAEGRECEPPVRAMSRMARGEPQWFNTSRGRVIFLTERPSPGAVADGWRAGRFKAAALVVAGGNALERATVGDARELPVLRPALPRFVEASTLFSNAKFDVRQSEVAWREEKILLLTRHDLTDGVALLAAISRRAAVNGRSRTDIHWYPRDGGTDAANANVAALERLYTTVLRLEPVQDFQFYVGRGHDLVKPKGLAARLSQADVLRYIAGARECAIAALGGHARTKLKPWRVVSMQPTVGLRNPLAVTAKVTNANGPVRGASVGFARDPHFACTAETNTQGVAACTLWDTHGDGDHHDDEKSTPPTVATFSGVVGPDSVDLPTTQVLHANHRAHR